MLNISSHVELPLAPGFTLPSVRYLNHTGAKGIFDGDNKMRCLKCGDEGKKKRGNAWYCIKHNRYIQIRAHSKSCGNAVPSHEELDSMVAALDSELHCPACGRKMNWNRKDNHQAVLTIQHDHSGEMRLICMSCNVRHAAYENDSYYDLPPGHKRCPRCNQILPYSDFAPCSGRFMGVQQRCHDCNLAYQRERYHETKKPLTPERLEYQRQYRASHMKERKEYMKRYYLDNREHLLARANARHSDS